MSRNKKIIYLVIVGVGGLGLVVDRLFLGESLAAPAQAQAAPGGVTEPVLPAVEPVGSTLLVRATAFPRNLHGADASHPVRDLFALSEQVRTLLLGPTGAELDSASADLASDSLANDYRTIESFSRRHRLEAVIVTGNQMRAVVDGLWIRIGQSVDECPLLRIEGRTAVFACRDGEARITVGGYGSDSLDPAKDP